MVQRLMLLMLLIGIEAWPISSSAQRSPRQYDMPKGTVDCPDSPPWLEERDELGGVYLAFPPSGDVLIVLRLVPIGSQLSGFLTEIDVEGQGIATTHPGTITGFFDDSNLSFTVAWDVGSFTWTGSWNERGLFLSYPLPDGSIDQGWMLAADSNAADLIQERFTNRHSLDGSANMAGYFLAGIPQVRAATDNQNVPIGPAAAMFGMPEQDAMSILLSGWLGTWQYSAYTDNAPLNQSDLYTLSFGWDSSVPILLASCLIDFRRDSDGFQSEDSGNRADFLYVSRSKPADSNGESTYDRSIVVTGKGPALAYFYVFGDTATQDAAIESALALFHTIDTAGPIGE